MPKDNNHFDTSTLSDAVLQMNFTAREGGKQLANVASNASKKRIPNDGLVLLDIKRDFPDAWHRFVNGCNDNAKLEIDLNLALFPYSFRTKTATIFDLGIIAESDCASLNWTVDFVGKTHCCESNRHDDCQTSQLRCTKSQHMCNLLFGGLEVEPQWLVKDNEASLLRLSLKSQNADLTKQIYLLVGYSIGEILGSNCNDAVR